MRRSTVLILELLIGLSTLGVGIALYSQLRGSRFLGVEGVVWQRDAYDCGTAALQMVFAHFRIPSDYKELTLRLEVGCGGTSMLRLKHAAESKGLLCSGWRLAVRDLSEIPLPAILFMRRNHFIVLDSCNPAGTILIRDPARGRLQLTMRRLESIWGGEALLFCHPGKGPAASDHWFRLSRLPERKPPTHSEMQPRMTRIN